jgi:hypothetical protein
MEKSYEKGQRVLKLNVITILTNKKTNLPTKTNPLCYIKEIMLKKFKVKKKMFGKVTALSIT